jgi:hypothetical protein
MKTTKTEMQLLKVVQCLNCGEYLGSESCEYLGSESCDAPKCENLLLFDEDIYCSRTKPRRAMHFCSLKCAKKIK